MFLLVLACNGDPSTTPDEVTNEPLDTGFGWPEDTDEPEETGTDADQDGWTVEDGDCDDADPYINPGWDEELGDGIDNDCDGWIDEQLVGVTALQVGDYKTEPARIHVIDSLGFSEEVVELDTIERYPIWLSEGVNGGWVVSDYANASVVEVDSEGGTTDIAEFGDYKEQTYGLITHPDGYYVVTTDTALYKVAPGLGTITELARWTVVNEKGTDIQDLWSVDVAYDSQTGDFVLFGLYGGLATVSAAGEFTLVRAGSVATDVYLIYAGGYHDGTNTLYAPGQSATTGAFDIYTWDEGWEILVDWPDEQQFSPVFMTVDAATDDFYVTANGATYPTIWQMDATTGDTQLFYESPYTGADVDFWDIYSRYDRS